MKVLGLILELNPPHNGHKYFIDKAIKDVQPDLTIAVISTNFSMRGDISVINKFDKINVCLDNNIDLVVELPYLGAVASADYFCANAIKILNSFGTTDIAFGCEMPDINKLRKLKDYLDNNEFNNTLKEYLQKGFSYSTSCNKALLTLTDDLDLIENFSMPNNTLAIQYIKTIDELNALKNNKDKEINIHLIKRIENNYYDTEVNSTIASATAIRELIASQANYKSYVIDNNIKYLDINNAYDKLLTIIKSKFILKNDISDFKNILGVKEGIENRIDNLIDQAINYSNLVNLTSTKRYTQNYLKRLFLNIILSIPEQSQKIDYLRILGFNAKGEAYIKKLPKDIKTNIITTFKNSSDENVKIELKATKLYSLLEGTNDLYKKEYQIPIRRK